jgi:hypothetical protein
MDSVPASPSHAYEKSDGKSFEIPHPVAFDRTQVTLLAEPRRRGVEGVVVVSSRPAKVPDDLYSEMR